MMSATSPLAATELTPEALMPLRGLSDHLRAGLIGLESLNERLLIALLTGGHVLIEGAPGLAKTRAIKRLAQGLGGSFARVQCTPDLMPSDITGTQIYHPDRASFSFREGPLFHNLVLVDEINRAPPKVQSALLEAMAEAQVTSGGETRALPDPFLVAATQNPIEQEGTFPLPEAQLDRFLFHIFLTLPQAEDERRILDLVEAENSQIQKPRDTDLSTGDRDGHSAAVQAHGRLGLTAIRAARQSVRQIHLAPALRDYIVRLTTATRQTEGTPLEGLIAHPVSPRGTLSLAAAARARAALHGRDHALPEDVTVLATDVLAHRLIPNWRATADGIDARNLVARLLDHVRPW